MALKDFTALGILLCLDMVLNNRAKMMLPITVFFFSTHRQDSILVLQSLKMPIGHWAEESFSHICWYPVYIMSLT